MIGVPLAYVTARFRLPGKALIAILPLTTLIVPEVIAGQTWPMMLATTGSSRVLWASGALSCRAIQVGHHRKA